ncbi:MAG: DUF4097 family beta strand repeat protein [Lachnospiraceae bacterium]|nr:DUF4097 family beta strand repeat protein [Lachnospiraceae bacterium]
MKKEEYMGALQAALQGFDEELAQEIVADYEERFRMGAVQGRTEEEIIRELGSIKGLVEELGEMQKESRTFAAEGAVSQKEVRKTEQSEHGLAVWQAAGNGGHGQNSTEDSQEKNQKKGTYFQDKSFSESFDAAMKKFGKALDGVMKEAGRVLEEAAGQFEMHMEEAKKNRYYTYNGDGTFEGSEKDGETEPNVEQSGQGAEGCRRVVVEADIADVKIRSGKEAQPAAVCHYYSHKTAMLYPFYAYQEGDTFYVGIRRQQNQERKSGFFQINMSPSVEIELTLPESVVLVEANGISGDIELAEVKAEELRLRSKSGDIEVGYLTGRDCRMESLSGNLKLVKSAVSHAELAVKSGDCAVDRLEADHLNISTASGDAEIRSITAGKVFVSTMSGDCTADDMTAELTRFSTASGDMELKDCRGGQLEASSASGDISVQADYGRYQIRSQSGDVELESRHDADVAVQSTSGDVTVRMVETAAEYQVVMHSVSGECMVTGQKQRENAVEQRQMEAKTISGDINIRFCNN